MKIIISPAKTLDFETKPKTKQSSKIVFSKESAQLVKQLQNLSEKKLGELMSLSPKLAKLNFERYETWSAAPQKQAILAYKGDVYEGLQAQDFSEDDFQFAQENLRIISGLYGILKPLDLIKPYRLEMSTKIGLYKFWGNKLTNEINNDLVVNLASAEYSKAINPENMITVNFYEIKNGVPKIIGLNAKKARGMMARYIIKNKIDNPEAIKHFNAAGYKFEGKKSDAKNYNFIR